MQVEANAQHPVEVANGLSKVLAATRALHLQTSDFHRRLAGPSCMTLRLLLDQQQDELRHAEAEIEARVGELSGGAKQVPEAPTPAASDGTMQAVDERIMGLVEGHETTVRAVLDAHRSAGKVNDRRTCDLLARRTDVHERAACTLGSMYLAARVSCEFCAARCPLSAAFRPGRTSAFGFSSSA
jgi:starvation-inducible DNA-binding protein